MEPISAFFERYLAAWHASGERGRFYHAPCMVIEAGTVTLNRTSQDIERFLAEQLKKHEVKGFSKAAFLAIDSAPLGSRSSIAKVRWACQDSRSRTLWEAAVTYNLVATAAAWKIVLETVQDS